MRSARALLRASGMYGTVPQRRLDQDGHRKAEAVADSDEQREEARGERRSLRVLVALIALVAVGAALKATAAVTVPLAFALFLVALFWPIYRALNRWVPSGIAAVGTLVVFVAFVGVIGGALWMSVSTVIGAAPSSSNELSEVVGDVREWAKQRGIPLGEGANGGGIQGLVERSGRLTFETLGGLVLVLAFLVLGVLEVHDYRDRIRQGANEEQARRWLGVIERVTHDFRRYFLVRTGIGLLTGVATAIACWALGLKSPLLWGVINFLLNYVPTLGSIIGVLPPTLFALVQFEGLGMPAAVFAAVGGVQLIMGNYIDPLVQGRFLSLSPVVVLLSVTFWGWVWGVVGALIGVPITMVIVLVCREFDSMRWIATLLGARPSRMVQPN